MNQINAKSTAISPVGPRPFCGGRANQVYFTFKAMDFGSCLMACMYKIPWSWIIGCEFSYHEPSLAYT